MKISLIPIEKKGVPGIDYYLEKILKKNFEEAFIVASVSKISSKKKIFRNPNFFFAPRSEGFLYQKSKL